MRYYIYLDKDFLRTLFAILDDSNFNIDVVEYAVRKSYTNNNEISLDPSLENGCSCENFNKVEKDKKDSRDNNYNNKRLRVEYDKGISYNIQTERKYINISDITDMKNINFYHKLIGSIENINKDRKDSRICKEEGYITIYEPNNRDGNECFDNKEGFFRINDTCIWYDKAKMSTDISLLSKMSCKIKVEGYQINCFESNNRIIKALAIYIE